MASQRPFQLQVKKKDRLGDPWATLPQRIRIALQKYAASVLHRGPNFTHLIYWQF